MLDVVVSRLGAERLVAELGAAVLVVAELGAAVLFVVELIVAAAVVVVELAVAAAPEDAGPECVDAVVSETECLEEPPHAPSPRHATTTISGRRIAIGPA